MPEKNISDLMTNLQNPSETRFRDFDPVIKVLNGGVQAKRKDSGVYKDRKTNVEYHFKSSEKFPGDDMAEVAGSIILVNFISEDNAKLYEFEKNLSQRNNFVRSKIIPGSKKLSQKNIHYRGKDWRGCTPTTVALKRKIDQECFTTPQLRRDMARILVGCKIILERDSQVDNLLEYTDANGNLRLQKFDNGHALRGILAHGKHRVILHENPSIFGQCMNHKGKVVTRILPTDHTNDYPDIVNSKEFLEEIDAAAKNLPLALEGVDQGLNAIMKKNRAGVNKELTEQLQKEALVIYANHLGYTGSTENKTAENLRLELSQQLKARLIERTQSLQLIKCLLQIKNLSKNLRLELKGKKAISLAQSRQIGIVLVNLIKTIKQFQGQHVSHFMPQLKDIKSSHLFKKLLKLSNLCNQQFLKTTGREFTSQKSLDFIASLRNKDTVIPAQAQVQVQVQVPAQAEAPVQVLTSLKVVSEALKKSKVSSNSGTLRKRGRNNRGVSWGTCEFSEEFLSKQKELQSKNKAAMKLAFQSKTLHSSKPSDLQKPSLLQIWEGFDLPAKKQQDKGLNLEPKPLTFMIGSLKDHTDDWSRIRRESGIRRPSAQGQDAIEALMTRLRSNSSPS